MAYRCTLQSAPVSQRKSGRKNPLEFRRLIVALWIPKCTGEPKELQRIFFRTSVGLSVMGSSMALLGRNYTFLGTSSSIHFGHPYQPPWASRAPRSPSAGPLGLPAGPPAGNRGPPRGHSAGIRGHMVRLSLRGRAGSEPIPLTSESANLHDPSYIRHYRNDPTRPKSTQRDPKGHNLYKKNTKPLNAVYKKINILNISTKILLKLD